MKRKKGIVGKRERVLGVTAEFVVLQTYLIPRSIAATTTLRRFYTDN